MILQTKIVHCEGFAFRAMPYSTPIDPFIMVLDDLSAHPTEACDVAEAIAECWSANNDIETFLYNLAPPGVNRRTFLRNHIRSTRALPGLMGTPGPNGTKGPGMRTVWKIYVSPPSHSIRLHTEWLTILTNAPLTIPFGVPRRLSFRKCDYCRATEHPTDLCPYQHHPNCPNIAPPKPREPDNNGARTEEAQHDFRSRGGRGGRGGRGRGGRGRGQGN